ncbi:MAG: DUF4367 domain-containing protein [Peptococcaceae bacterium]
MKLSEEQLRRAALLAQQRQQYQTWNARPEPHQFSASFEQTMQQLMAQLQQHQLAQNKAPMGWQYYMRSSIAAVLLCFLLACVTMPEAVMAGCQKVIQAVETVFERYTEFQYHSSAAGTTAFVPMQFGYLPDGMVEEKHRETETSIHILYRNDNTYFMMMQELLMQDDGIVYGVDTEDAEQQLMQINGEEVRFIYKENRIHFIWLHDAYHITGQTNLPEHEVIKILEHITFE